MVADPIETAPPDDRSERRALPRAWPLVGHFPAYGRDPLGFVMRVTGAAGGVAPIRLGPFPGLLLSDPGAIEEVLVTRQRDFRKSPATRRVAVVVGDGLVVSDGEAWREHRRAVQPAFHHERIKAWAQVMVDEAQAAVDRWADGALRDVHHEMVELTLRIVVRTLLGSTVEREEVDDVGRAAAVLTDHFESRFNGLSYFIPDALPTPGNRRMRAAVARLDRIIYRLIGERRRRPGTDDVVSMLLEQATPEGRRLSDREVRDEVMTLFMAGHETTALALTWALYLLGRDEAAETRLQAEVDDVLGDRPPAVLDLPELRWTEAVIYEALRLYPPAYAISREAITPTSIAGRPVSRRTVVFISVYAAHRNAERFPQPDRFLPQRWLDGLARRLPRGAYVPFAEGPRKCIGASFAMQEATLVLAEIARRVRLRPTDARTVGVRPAVTLRPAGPIEMIVEPRDLVRR